MRRSVGVWAIVLGLAAVLWEAPVGLREFGATSLPTRVVYSVLTVGGIVLVLAGAALLRVKRSWLAAVGCGAAAVLAINQAVGLWCNAILCFSPG
jgi:hypothetical protein